jgi:hypothetical protein
MTLGYVVLGGKALRLDLAEKVARSLSEDEAERQALACLALPRRDWPSVLGAFRAALGQP